MILSTLLKLFHLTFLAGAAAALDNGLRVPPMGWSSWYESHKYLYSLSSRGRERLFKIADF